MKTSVAFSLLGAALGVSLSACSANDATPPQGGTLGGLGSGAGTSGGATSGVIIPSTTGGATGAGGVGGLDQVGEEPTCGGYAYDAQPAQLDMYVMFDDSASMVPWWPGFLDVFGQFLDDPASAGIGVGLQFFGDSCDVNFYATPKVPIAPLPGNAAAIKAAFPLLPSEGTSTEPALRGALQHARAWQTQNPTHKAVVLLVTDGVPSECDSTVDNVTVAAREGFTGTPSIPTYILGLSLPGVQQAMDTVAAQGGTDRAVIADPANAQALASAMAKIRVAALPCDYAVPTDDKGGEVDRSKVNLQLTNGTERTTIPKVADPTACDAAGGWHYDEAGDRIIACPTTCSTFKATSAGKVNVVVGCDTLIR